MCVVDVGASVFSYDIGDISVCFVVKIRHQHRKNGKLRFLIFSSRSNQYLEISHEILVQKCKKITHMNWFRLSLTVLSFQSTGS